MISAIGRHWPREWVPLALTLSRLGLCMAAVPLILNGRHKAAFLILFAAILTDLLDGWAARRLKVAGPGGAWADAAVDKAAAIMIFGAAALAGLIPWWLTLIIWARDLALGAGAVAQIRARGWIAAAPQPQLLGRLALALQALTIFQVLLGFWPEDAGTLHAATAAVTLVAAITYARAAGVRT